MMRIIVSYDISNDKRRTKIAKIIKGYGYRVQYSVFECDLDPKKLTELKRRLRPLVRRKEGDSVRFYPLPADAVRRIFVLGHDGVRILEPIAIV